MEEFKSIKDYEDYQVSNLGNVKSLKFGNDRKPFNSHGYHSEAARKRTQRHDNFLLSRY
jgi:hypothetical protein